MKTREELLQSKREYMRNWREQNPEEKRARDKRYRETHVEQIRERKRAYGKTTLERSRERNRQFRINNPEKCRQYAKTSRERHPKRNQEYVKQRRARDVGFRIRLRLRAQIGHALNGNMKVDSTMKLLGCSIESFRIYLESKFQTGMTWDNYGREGWHIDHIMPCSIFDMSKPEHQKRCFHFSNLQPMWANENRSKNNRVTTNQFNLI